MAKTILGYEVASPEQQRKTALAILGFVGVAAIAGIGVLFLVSHWEQSGRQQAIAKIVSFETKCRYAVRNIGKRVSYYDHTGYIGCAQARAVANSNNNPLGSVQRRTLVVVEFNTDEDRRLRTSVAFHGDTRFSVGQQVEILYRTDNPRDAIEFNRVPLFGKKSITPTSETTSAAQTEPVEKSAENPPPANAIGPMQRPSDSVSESTKLWIGLIAILVMVLTALWIVRFIYRMAKRLVFGRDHRNDARATSQPVTAMRMNAVTGRPAQKSFGRPGN